MAGLTDTTIAASYDQLLIVDRDCGGNGTTHVAVKDGDGTTTFPVTLASDAIMITSTNRLEFGDDASYIHQSEDGVLDLVSDTEIEINATTIDINGALDVSGNITMADDTSIGIGDSAERIEFDGTGDISVLGANFGIGTDSPVALLTIKDSTGDSDGIAKGLVLLADDSGQHTSSDIAGIITFAGRNAGGTNKISAQITSPSSSNWNDTVANGYGQIAFSVGQGSAVNEKMRVTNNGVGIGTISPDGLEVASKHISVTGTYSMKCYGVGVPGATDTEYLDFAHDSSTGNARINTRASGTGTVRPLLFLTNGTERMRITSGGDVYIGTANEGLSINGNTGGAGTITGINQALSAYKKLVLNATDFSFKISGTEKMRLMSAGELVIPSQPAFMAYPSGTQSDIANDSNVEIAFGTERFDQGSNFASNTFTAPATGKYQLNVSLEFTNMDSAATYYQVNLATSNDIYYFYIDPDFGQDTAGSFTVGGSVLADMDTNDTAVVQVRTSDGTAQMDVATQSFFSGFLAC